MTKVNNLLSASEKRDFKAAIIRRQVQVMAAIKVELDTDGDRVLEQMRKDYGVISTPTEIRELISGINSEITEIIKTRLSSMQRQIELETEDVEEEYDELQRTMRERHKKEWEELIGQRKAKLEEMKSKARKAEEEVAALHCGELMAKKKELHIQLVDAQNKEAKIVVEARQRSSLAGQYRARAEMVVADAASRALEGLLTASTASEANKLLKQIPTAVEAVELCQQGVAGLRQLFKRLNTQLALPAPVESTQLAENEDEENDDTSVVVPAVISVPQLDRWQVNRDTSEHNAIYRDGD